jgi:hypothetical protein
MIVNYLQFTPFESFVGGAIIGLASVLMMLMFGRIAGISGILGTALDFPKNDTLWRYAFLFGIISSGFIFSPFIDKSLLSNSLDYKYVFIIMLAGLLVGFGTRLGSGCTSGHGICGISRLSMRSVLATATFLLSGVVTVLIMKLIN